MIGKLLRLACFGLVIATAQQSQAGICPLWYNGDPDLVDGLANELNSFTSDALVYEDFIVTPNCSIICAVYSNNFMSFTATTAAWEIRTGVGPGTGGTLVASGTGAATQTLNGFDNPLVSAPIGYTIMVSGLNVALTPGTYWLSVAPIGQGFGRSFVQSTSGANAFGAPIQNNNAIFNSSQFGGYSWAPADLGFGLPLNYSMGVYAVPEPSSLVILGIGGGLLGLNLVRRRRAK
jgi:hypothetical protein